MLKDGHSPLTGVFMIAAAVKALYNHDQEWGIFLHNNY
jgi:hypothetical protein